MNTLTVLAGTLLCTLLCAAQADAASIFVRPTRGSDLTRSQQAEVTGLVQRAVRNIPEHNLVTVEKGADFVLQPSVVVRNDQQLLRVEKIKNGEILAMSEEAISSVNASNDRATAVTETALQGDPAVAPARSSDSRMVSQDIRAGGTESGTTMSASDNSTASSAPATAEPGIAGDVRAPSPAVLNRQYPGYMQAGIGPAFGTALGTNSAMTNITALYNYDLNRLFDVRGGIDASFASGSDRAQLIDVLVGSNFYPSQTLLTFGTPYIGADLGYAFARDNRDRNADGIALGVGTGFKFAVEELNMDASLRYSILSAQIDGTSPSVLGLRLAFLF